MALQDRGDPGVVGGARLPLAQPTCSRGSDALLVANDRRAIRGVTRDVGRGHRCRIRGDGTRGHGRGPQRGPDYSLAPHRRRHGPAGPRRRQERCASRRSVHTRGLSPRSGPADSLLRCCGISRNLAARSAQALRDQLGRRELRSAGGHAGHPRRDDAPRRGGRHRALVGGVPAGHVALARSGCPSPLGRGGGCPR